MTITTTQLPVGVMSAAYSATLAAIGGTPPYVWSIASGTLPAGLTLAAGTGVISGTPTANGAVHRHRAGDRRSADGDPEPGPLDRAERDRGGERAPGQPRQPVGRERRGRPDIQGFATDISVNKGETVSFKVKTDSTNYRIDIYRLGYYGGLGARLVATVQPSATLPQTQPACLSDISTGLVDCGNWAVSASWTCRRRRPRASTSPSSSAQDPEDGRASHIPFIVRDDAGHSDLLFQTSDTTWQAYNTYGGNSLYFGSPAGRAYKVSYNRPFTTRCCEFPNGSTETWLFNTEYPMIRWLERNGYDVSYTTGVDTDRRGAELLEHRVFMPVGHDEYWSGGERANVEAARAAGVHIAIFSGNHGFWKTRWENSIDGSNTPYRTLVCYKETHANAKIDPAAERVDGDVARPALQPAGRRRPSRERAQRLDLHGERHPQRRDAGSGSRRQDALLAQHQHRVAGRGPDRHAPDGRPRNRVGRGPRQRLPASGRRSHVDDDRVRRAVPAGLRHDLRVGNRDAPPHPLQELLRLARVRRGHHPVALGPRRAARLRRTPTDANMQQATVNLFADMGVQPVTLQSGLVAATASTDTTAPTATITSPAAGATVVERQAGDHHRNGERQSAVRSAVSRCRRTEALTWHPAVGRTSWTYAWLPTVVGSTSAPRPRGG